MRNKCLQKYLNEPIKFSYIKFQYAFALYPNTNPAQPDYGGGVVVVVARSVTMLKTDSIRKWKVQN